MTEGQQGKQAGPGVIGDAPTAFGDALLAAAKTLGHAPAADPHVTAAVQLGWVMGSLITPGAQTPLPSGVPIDEATVYKAKAIELPRLLALVGVTPKPGPQEVTETLETGAPAMTEAGDWESTLVAALLAQDVRLAKAFGVGRQLNLIAYPKTPVQPDVPLTSKELNSDGVTGMVDALDDLTSALPPHAGRAVAYSVRAWQKAHEPPVQARGLLARARGSLGQPQAPPPQAEAPADQAPELPTREVLQAQCELWRTVVTGEKAATQLLEPENYIDAAENLAVKLRATATVLLRQYAPWVALVVVLLLAGAAVLLFVHSAASETAAGLSSVLVALGLTWKGIGTTLGKLAAQVEGPLWGAEVDGAVTAAITLEVRVPPPANVRTTRNKPGGDYAKRTQRRPGFDPSNPPPA